jgi:hypothetical protein
MGTLLVVTVLAVQPAFSRRELGLLNGWCSGQLAGGELPCSVSVLLLLMRLLGVRQVRELLGAGPSPSCVCMDVCV